MQDQPAKVSLPSVSELEMVESSRAEVEAVVAPVLAAPAFLRNPTASRFLRFIVDEALAGRGDRLKAFTIATLALNRSADFDPQTDSTVRVNALRLRQLLDDYYSGPGDSDPWRIDIPRGGYKPRIVCRPPSIDSARDAPAAPTLASIRRFGARPLAAVLLLLLCVAMVGLGAWILSFSAGARGGSEILEPPVLVIRPPQFDGPFPRDGAMPKRALAAIESHLDTMDYVVVRTRDAYRSSSDGYVLDTRFRPRGPDQFDADLKLTRSGSSEPIWTRHFDAVNGGDIHALDAMARTATAAIADIGGVIFSDLRARLPLSSGAPSALTCRLTALTYLRERDPALKTPSQDCLETLIVADPDNATLLRLLSTLLLFDFLDGLDSAAGAGDLQRALLLARRAYDVAPQQANGQAALFFARFFDKRYEDAFQLMREALASGPDSVLIATRAGRMLVSRGQFDAGDALLRQAEELNGGSIATTSAFLGLSALYRDDRPALNALADNEAMSKSPLGLALRVIAFSRRGDHALAAETAKSLRAAFPHFSSDVPSALDRYGLVAPLKIVMTDALAQTPEFELASH